MDTRLNIAFVDDSKVLCDTICDILTDVYENKINCNQFNTEEDIKLFPEWVKKSKVDIVFLDFCLFPSENNSTQQAIEIYKQIIKLKKKPRIYWLTGMFDSDPRLQVLQQYFSSIEILKKPIIMDTLIKIINKQLS